MTPSKKVVLVGVSLLTISAALASVQSFADTGVDVIKNNGTLAHYQLLPVHHDARHAEVVKARLENRSILSSILPADHEISHQALPPIRDQGSRGTCAYFATVGILEAHYMAASSSFGKTRLSEECLVDVRNWESDTDSYTGDDKPDERPDPNGDWPQLLMKTVNNYGVVEAKTYSSGVDCTYNGNNTQGNDVSTDQLNAIISSGQSSAYGKEVGFAYNAAPTIDTLKALIAANIPVEVGILVYNEYMDGVDWRFDATQDNDNNLAGGHAIILTGYTTQNGKTIFTFKNSWGSDWGHDGFGTIDDGILTNSWAYDPHFDMTLSVK